MLVTQGDTYTGIFNSSDDFSVIDKRVLRLSNLDCMQYHHSKKTLNADIRFLSKIQIVYQVYHNQ